MLRLPPRVLELLRRELAITSATLCPPGESSGTDDAARQVAPVAALTMSVPAPRGYALVVTWDEWPAVAEDELRARLEVLANSTSEALEDAIGAAPRRSAHELLHDELIHIRDEASAWDVVLVDAQSEVVWGAARAPDALPRPPLAEIIPLDRGARASSPALERTPSDRAIRALRARPELASVAKGTATLAFHESDGDPPVFVRTLASIYLLVLVYDSAFDQLRAERVFQQHHGRLERLIVALPPIDPTPDRRAKALRG